MIASINFFLKYFELLAIEIILSFTPSRATFLILKTPVTRKYRRQYLKLIASNKHFIYLDRIDDIYDFWSCFHGKSLFEFELPECFV